MRQLWVLLCAALAGCGDDTHATIDGPGTPVDSPEPDARESNAPITIIALSMASDGLPDPNAVAVFVGPDQVEHEAHADAQGHMTGTLPMGGDVTVIHGGATSSLASLTVVRGVHGGDTLTVGRPLRPFFVSGADLTMSITVPPLGGASASSYHLAWSCDHRSVMPNQASTVSFRAGCHTTTADLFATATVSSTDHRYLYAPDVAVTNGGAALLPATWQGMSSGTVSATGLPATAMTTSISRGVVIDRGIVQIATAAISPGTTTGTQTAPAPIGIGLAAAAQASVMFADGNQLVLVHQEAASATNMSIALSPLPHFDTRPVLSGGAISWTETRAGTPDARISVIQIVYAKSGGGTLITSITIVDDGTGSSIPLPKLPASLGTTGPTGTPNGFGVYYEDVDSLAGYDAARPYSSLLVDGLNNPGLTRPFSLTVGTIY